jgi:acyl-CoA thioester hydrolase
MSGSDTIASLNWDHPSPFIVDLKVGEGHIDGLGHVNNSVYVGWCQDAGWAHSVSLGLDLQSYRDLDSAMVIRHAEYDYIGAAYLDDECFLGTWLTASDGRLNMERRFQLIRRDGRTLLRARWQLVCIRMSNGRAMRMPADFVHTYGSVVVATND